MCIPVKHFFVQLYGLFIRAGMLNNIRMYHELYVVCLSVEASVDDILHSLCGMVEVAITWWQFTKLFVSHI